MEAHFYHGASRGLETEILFNSTDEFIAGMNRMAICLMLCPGVMLYAYCLMDNHIHVILYGTYDDCKAFLHNYKRLTSIWWGHHGLEASRLEQMDVDIWQIRGKDKLQEKLVYVYRNPCAAHLPYSPQGYRWSTASLQFADSTHLLKYTTAIKTLSLRERRRKLGSKVEIPGDWLIFDDGLIWPGSYVKVKCVNDLFGTPANYQFLLNKSVESETNTEMNSEQLSLPKADVIAVRDRILLESFANVSPRNLDVQQRLSLAKMIKRGTGTSYKQISGLVHLPYDTIKKTLI